MQLFDLVFIAVFLASVAALGTAVWLVVRGRRGRALAILRGWAICAVLYLGTVAAVALATPRRVLPVGELRCYDDWCIGVADARREADSSAVRYSVTLRLASRARRVTQRERGLEVYLEDEQGRRYYPEADPTAVPLDVVLGPGQAVSAARSFRVAPDARGLGLVFAHTGLFPGVAIIGDDQSLLHKPAIVRLP